MDDAFRVCGKSLQEIKRIPFSSKNLIEDLGNNLLMEEMSYDIFELHRRHES